MQSSVEYETVCYAQTLQSEAGRDICKDTNWILILLNNICSIKSASQAQSHTYVTAGIWAESKTQ